MKEEIGRFWLMGHRLKIRAKVRNCWGLKLKTFPGNACRELCHKDTKTERFFRRLHISLRDGFNGVYLPIEFFNTLVSWCLRGEARIVVREHSHFSVTCLHETIHQLGHSGPGKNCP